MVFTHTYLAPIGDFDEDDLINYNNYDNDLQYLLNNPDYGILLEKAYQFLRADLVTADDVDNYSLTLSSNEKMDLLYDVDKRYVGQFASTIFNYLRSAYL